MLQTNSVVFIILPETSALAIATDINEIVNNSFRVRVSGMTTIKSKIKLN